MSSGLSWQRLCHHPGSLIVDGANDNLLLSTRAWEAWFEPWFCDEPMLVEISDNVHVLIRPAAGPHGA